ncbi:hypothetical protein [Francisella sp. SYW-9]|uniref:hypothetical protein n=1 Tax=Francisella sp. SYW-9 TaxID=2610888 RepID=UPI00123D6F46|nr:hypothetical protein [Francisella sp. SYW-9]
MTEDILINEDDICGEAYIHMENVFVDDMEEELISFKELEDKWNLTRNTLFRYAKDLGIRRIKQSTPHGSYRYGLTYKDTVRLKDYKNQLEDRLAQIYIRDMVVNDYLKTAFGQFGSRKFME